MTILSSTSRVPYVGNGSVSNYSFTFKIFSEDDLLVTVRHPTTGAETTLTITTDYTVTILANGTGSIDLVDDSQAWLTGGFLTDDWVLVIRRVVDLIQDTDIRNQGAFYPEAHENTFDYLMMSIQQVKDEVDRSLKVAETDDALTLRLPTAAERASQFLGFDAVGQPIAAGAVTGVAASAYIQTLMDDPDAAAARTTLGLVGTLATDGNVGTSALVDDAVTNAKLANMAALSIKGNGTNASANPTDLAAANDYEVIQRVGTAIAFGPYKKKYRNAITTDTISLTDDVVVFSGASFTATLPSAVGCMGKELTLQHGGTNFSQVYTLAVTGGGTIGGIDSGSYAMYSNGETLKLISNDVNWLISYHLAETDWIEYTLVTAVDIKGTTTDPTFATSPIVKKGFYRRSGRDLLWRLEYKQPNSTGAANGSGDYKFLVPAGLSIDTTLTTVYATIPQAYATGPLGVLGHAFVSSNGAFLQAHVFPFDANYVRLMGFDLGVYYVVGAANYQMGNANAGYSIMAQLPIVGWRP